jgi:acid phosphatase (class A)
VFAESRLVCGVHWATDVDSGFVTAAILVATLHESADFRADVASLGREIGQARAAPPDAGRCQLEADAAAHPVLFTPAK